MHVPFLISLIVRRQSVIANAPLLKILQLRDQRLRRETEIDEEAAEFEAATEFIRITDDH